MITRPVNIIGIRPEDRAKTGDFGEFLVDDHNQKIAPSFEVTDELKLSSPPERSSRSSATTRSTS